MKKWFRRKWYLFKQFFNNDIVRIFVLIILCIFLYIIIIYNYSDCKEEFHKEKEITSIEIDTTKHIEEPYFVYKEYIFIKKLYPDTEQVIIDTIITTIDESNKNKRFICDEKGNFSPFYSDGTKVKNDTIIKTRRCIDSKYN